MSSVHNWLFSCRHQHSGSWHSYTEGHKYDKTHFFFLMGFICFIWPCLNDSGHIRDLKWHIKCSRNCLTASLDITGNGWCNRQPDKYSSLRTDTHMVIMTQLKSNKENRDVHITMLVAGMPTHPRFCECNLHGQLHTTTYMYWFQPLTQ